ncbi:hypothetical protein [Tessaracoccus sp.]
MSEDLPGVTDITDSAPPPRTGGIRWFAVVLLVGYLALLAIGAGSIWVIAGQGVAGWIAAIVFVLLYATAWRIWLAAGAHRRLAFKERVTVHLVAGPVVVVLGSLAHVWLPALLALSMVVMCDALDRRDHRPATTRTPS